MTTPYFERRDEKTAERHAMIAQIAGELGALPARETESGDAKLAGLRASWAKLIEVMALEPVPAARACPTCTFIGLRAATKCMNCWIELVPPAAEPVVAAAKPAVVAIPDTVENPVVPDSAPAA